MEYYLDVGIRVKMVL